MTSKVDICNLALSSLGSKQTIQDIDSDESVEARTCRLHYDQALHTTLAARDWAFATKDNTSARITTYEPADWNYVYAWPAKAVRIVGIVDPLGSRRLTPRKFRTITYSGNRVLLTDTEAPVWRYVYENTDSTTYSPAFIDAMVAQLSSRIAMPLTRKESLRESALKLFQQLIAGAATVDANEGFDGDEPAYTAQWFDDRGYSGASTIRAVDADGNIIEIEGKL